MENAIEVLNNRPIFFYSNFVFVFSFNNCNLKPILRKLLKSLRHKIEGKDWRHLLTELCNHMLSFK